jgi:hypothetical protein
MSAWLRSAFFFLSALNSASPSRISRRGSPPTMSDQLLDLGLAGRLLEVFADRRLDALLLRSSSVSRDLLQRGLCQIVMVIVRLIPR